MLSLGHPAHTTVSVSLHPELASPDSELAGRAITASVARLLFMEFPRFTFRMVKGAPAQSVT